MSEIAFSVQGAFCIPSERPYKVVRQSVAPLWMVKESLKLAMELELGLEIELESIAELEEGLYQKWKKWLGLSLSLKKDRWT
jgi:hypothetical protein